MWFEFLGKTWGGFHGSLAPRGRNAGDKRMGYTVKPTTGNVTNRKWVHEHL